MQTVNEVDKKEKHLKSKTKSFQPTRKTSAVERTLLGNPPEIADKTTKKTTYRWLDIKLEQFMSEKLYAVMKKIKTRKNHRPWQNTAWIIED